jgi:hypothetical protein
VSNLALCDQGVSTENGMKTKTEKVPVSNSKTKRSAGIAGYIGPF